MITTFSAVVLAAGRSTRMGTDKALLRVGDGVLWRRQCELLRDAGATDVFLSARADQAWAAEPEATRHFDAIVRDALPDCGPLGGIAAALERATASHLAVLAIDLPRMQASWFRRLAAQAGDDVGVVGRQGGYFEPLAALYPKSLYEAAQAALAVNNSSLQRLITAAVARGALRELAITGDETIMFENWNEP
jgi:molybdenum cofactor guanylyltransferase